MEGFQYLPALIWVFITAIVLLLVLLALGFYWWYSSRVKAVIEDASAVADLAARKDQLEAEIEQSLRWLENNKEELLKRDAERKQQENDRQELANLQTELAKTEEKANDFRKEASDLQNVVSSLSKDRDRLEAEKIAFEKKKDEANRQTNAAEEIKVQAIIKAKDAKEELEDKHRELIGFNDKIIELSLKRDSFIKEISDKERQRDEMHSILDKAKMQKKKALEEAFEEEKKAELFKKQNEKYQHEIDQKQHHLNEIVGKITGKFIQNDTLTKEIDSKQNKIEDLKTVLIKLESQQNDAEKKVKQTEEQFSDAKQNLKIIKDEAKIQESIKEATAIKVQKYNSEIDNLKLEKTELKSSIKSLEVLLANKQLDGQKGDTTANEEKYRDLWHPVSFSDLSPVTGSPDERELLKNTATYIKGQKLHFPERVLYAFHTALKISDISPITVLAGISGTGKSELPRRYAEGMGIHSIILPVQPRWDSPQDLFGFYNYLEGRYKATELARAMVQFELYNRDSWPLPQEWDHNLSDRMLLVLLDEMNLARVEYYFSEFLSRLETRRGINLNDDKKRAKAEIVLEMGSLRKGDKPIKLFPGQNILFAGTMNEDETTQALSDKVLDRAGVIRFGRPKKITEKIVAPEKEPPKKEPSKNGLTYDQWNSWLNEKLSASDQTQVNKWINELNDAMDELHRPFAYRVALSIQSYVAKYPVWVPNRIGIAMADQIEQKIMPKLRGIEIDGTEQPREKIRSIIAQCEDSDLLDAFEKGSQEQQIFIWKGLDRTKD
ncbi:MAG: hypothetical protein JJV89_05730 [Desulfosarcina sp.]|nr:hypothetical protein [Desulfobacterales bacterium]